LTYWAFDVEGDPRHLREEIDIGDPECAAAEPQFCRLSPARRKRDIGAAVANGDRM
jgi:hypothetical protein